MRRIALPLVLAALALLFACGGGGGGSTPPPATPPSTPPSGPQVLLNGGMEGSAPLAWAGDTGVIQTAPGSSDPRVVPHSGSQFAWLSGYGSVATDTLFQDVYIPASATSAQLSFWVKIVSDETGAVANDHFTVQARSTSNAVLGTLLTKSNLDAGSSYVQLSASLLPYKGQVVRLYFEGTENASLATSFLLDDVAVNILVPTPTDLAPVVSSFTPTSGVLGVDTVQISGGNFFGVTAVTIGGASASFTIKDGTSLSATVPAGAAVGAAPISITNAQGTGTSVATFTSGQGLPTLGAVNPTQGPVGTPVVINGTYLGYAGTTVTFNGTAATISAQSQTQLTVTVPAGATTGNLVVTTPTGSLPTPFTVNAGGPTLDLHVDKIQLTQSTQTLDNAVPIVAGKDGLIRVFVLANQSNAVTPSVSVTLLNNGVAVAGYPHVIAAPGSVPTALNEGSLSSSWNWTVPAAELTTPTGTGYSIQATVDPGNAVPEADETNNTTTVTLTGTTVPQFKTTIFPVVLSSGTGNVSAGANATTWVARLKKMYPIADVDVQVGSPYTDGTVSALQSDGTGWDTLLSNLAAKHQADAGTDASVATRYYYGALKVSYSSGVAGLGYVPNTPGSSFQFRTAIGWDKTGYSDGGNYPEVFAHETGHNMGRPHSPCGGAAGPDPAYPYANAVIGAWGYDSTTGGLKDPTAYYDIMAYCSPNWVSDYVYKKILAFRGGAGGFLAPTGGPAEDAALPPNVATGRECLLVRGLLADDGRVTLLPAFRTRALPTALASAGTHTLEGLDAAGRPLFSAPIEWMEVGCAPKAGTRHFLLALPLDAAQFDALASLQIRKDGQVIHQKRSGLAGARVVVADPETRSEGPDQIRVRWDATVHPTVMIRDGATGEVLAITQGGEASLPTPSRVLDLILSDGVTSLTRRVQAQP